MKDGPALERAQVLSDALKQLESAMELLDSAGAPAQIAAHVDLAAWQLRDVIGTEPQIARIVQQPE